MSREVDRRNHRPILGDWELRVTDLVGQETGKLNAWRSELTH